MSLTWMPACDAGPPPATRAAYTPCAPCTQRTPSSISVQVAFKKML